MKNTLIIFALCALLFAPSALAQFTTGNDTLVILTGDSTTYYYTAYNSVADTSGGSPFTKTAGYDLNGKALVGVDFDTTSAWTSAKFAIQTSATYNEGADTTGGTPYDWKTVNYEDSMYVFTPETKAINILKPQVIYALKRYIRFICLDSGGTWTANEAARRKLIPLIRSAF